MAPVMDFRQILKDKSGYLGDPHSDEFKNIYQGFQQSVGQFGLGDVDSYYNTAKSQVKAMQEAQADAAAASWPQGTPTPTNTNQTDTTQNSNSNNLQDRRDFTQTGNNMASWTDWQPSYNFTDPTRPSTVTPVTGATGSNYPTSNYDFGATATPPPMAQGGAFNTPTDLTGQINSAFDQLAQATQTNFGNLQTQDFTEQIRALVESGRVDIRSLNAEQLAMLNESEQRRMGQINQIQGDLQGQMGQQEQYRQGIQQQVAAGAKTRADQMTADQQARIAAGRGALGQQVTSEFEEVAALTGGLTGSQAQSTTAGMDRLATVANQGAAARMAAPAQLAAEAKMAVGDEKFRLENELASSLSASMAELSAQEREQVMQEKMRLEQFGVETDQALAQALTAIAGQQTTATLNEAGRLEDISQRQGEITQQQDFQSASTAQQQGYQSQERALDRGASAETSRLARETTKEDNRLAREDANTRFNTQINENIRQFDSIRGREDAARVSDSIQRAKERGWDVEETTQRQENWQSEYDLAFANAMASAGGSSAPMGEPQPGQLLYTWNASFPGINDSIKLLAMSLADPTRYTEETRNAVIDGWGERDPIGGGAMSTKDIQTIKELLVIADQHHGIAP